MIDLAHGAEDHPLAVLFAERIRQNATHDAARGRAFRSLRAIVQFVPFETGEALSKLKVDQTPVFYCKTGVRSAEVLAIVKKAGFSDALHVQGGIVAWGKQLEPDMVMY